MTAPVTAGATVNRREVDVAIVGGGPAGLSAGIWLRRLGVARVLVLEREEMVGGVPRHCSHRGFGLRDLHRFTTGPRYSALYRRTAEQAGVTVATCSMATGWDPDGALRVTGTSGLTTVGASAVLLATGARERPRPARLVAGDRGAGIYTTGELQQAVYLHNQRIGNRGLVVGAEHVSYSAALTLRHAGVELVGMITDQPKHQTYAAFSLGARFGLRVTAQPNTRIVSILGRPRVTAVVLEDVQTGARRQVACDTVVFTGDWIPDNELVRSRGVDLDAGTLGPAVDAAAQTSRQAVFAAGNLCHPVETADVAAVGGRGAARSIARWLASQHELVLRAAVPITVDDNLRWVYPQRLTDTSTRPAGRRYLLRPRLSRRHATLVVVQGDRVLWRGRRRLVPNLTTSIPDRWVSRVDGHGPTIRIEVEE